MLDCGGQGSFIDDKLSQTYHLPCLPKRRPVTILLANGESAPDIITHYNLLLVHTGGSTKFLGLDIATTAHDQGGCLCRSGRF